MMKTMQFKDGRNYRIRDIGFDVKSVEDDGTFTGYGSVFGVVDSYQEVVIKGAFTESLSEIKASGRPLPALWQHMSGEPIGRYDILREDDNGLFVSGRLLKTDVQRAREAYALMKEGIVSGLSIGYYVRDSSYDEKKGIRTLKNLELVEVSIVTFPANDAARVESVKSLFKHGAYPTVRQFESFLRDAGMSKSDALELAATYRGIVSRRDSEGDEGEAILKALEGFSLNLN